MPHVPPDRTLHSKMVAQDNRRTKVYFVRRAVMTQITARSAASLRVCRMGPACTRFHTRLLAADTSLSVRRRPLPTAVSKTPGTRHAGARFPGILHSLRTLKRGGTQKLSRVRAKYARAYPPSSTAPCCHPPRQFATAHLDSLIASCSAALGQDDQVLSLVLGVSRRES